MTHSNDTRRPQSIEERIRIQLVKWKRRAESYGPRHGEVCFIAEPPRCDVSFEALGAEDLEWVRLRLGAGRQVRAVIIGWHDAYWTWIAPAWAKHCPRPHNWTE